MKERLNLARFRRREQHQHLDVLGDVDEPVLDALGDERDRPRLDRTALAVHLQHGATREDVVDLVLGVRVLRVRLPGGQAVDAGAEHPGAHELGPRLARPARPVEDMLQVVDDVPRLGHRADRTRGQSGTIATTRAGAALPPMSRSGKHATSNPWRGSLSRLTSRSIWEYGRSHWWAAQNTPGSPLSLARSAWMCSGSSQPHASMPITRTPRSNSHRVASAVTPGPRAM